MDRELAPCRDCRAPVPAESTTCPSCGYDVDRHERWRLLLGLAGTLLTVSLAFAPVGLPVLWRAHRHQLAAAGTVTEPRTVSLRDRLSTVLSEHVGLGPAGPSRPAARRSRAAAETGDVLYEPR